MMAITCALIGECVCEYYGVTYFDLVSARRTRPLIIPRHVAYWLARKLTPKSYPEIGRNFGGRDHTSIIHGTKSMDDLIQRQPLMRAEVREIETIILASDGVLANLSAQAPQDHDPVVIADRLINTPLSRMQLSSLELRILAGAVLNQASDRAADEAAEIPDLREPVKATIKALEDWKSSLHSPGERAANINLERQLSALKARFEQKEITA